MSVTSQSSFTLQNKLIRVLSSELASPHKLTYRSGSRSPRNVIADKRDVDSFYSHLSYNCMEGVANKSDDVSSDDDLSTLDTSESNEILTVSALKFQIERLFKLHKSQEISLDMLRSSIIDLLKKVDLTTSEINKFTYWDTEKSYTRNLVATDNENYNLLLLCWTPGMESKIHNHPCDTCYMKAIRGSIQETRYKADTVNNKVIETSVKFLNENQGMYFFYHTL